MNARYLLVLLCCFCYNSLFSQEYVTRLAGMGFTVNNSEISQGFTLRATQDESGFTKVTVEDLTGEIANFLVKPFSLGLFQAKMKSNVFGQLSSAELLEGDLDESSENDQRLVQLYSDISSYFQTVNERPQVATIALKDKIRVYAEPYFKFTNENRKKKKERKRIVIGYLQDPSVDISFYSGFIEKIEVRGTLAGNEVRFSNKYSIGVSSLKNIKAFDKIRLFSILGYDIGVGEWKQPTTGHPPVSLTDPVIRAITPKLTKTKVVVNDQEYAMTIQQNQKSQKIDAGAVMVSTGDVSLLVYLEDVIDYQRIINVNANDISPDTQKVNLDNQQLSAKLYREESTKIVEAVVYTDLLGTLDEANPNGIIQTEINKKFNISTKRTNFFQTGGYGILEYLDAQVLLSKIEENNKYLFPVNNSYALLDLFRYRNFSVGGLVNFGTMENQNFKMNIFYDSGFKFSRSGYQLSEDTGGQNVNTIEWVHQLKIHIFPERRYGVVFRDKLFYYEVLDTDTEFIPMLNKKKDWFNTIELSAYLDIATSAKVFVRYALVHEFSNFSNNFSRFQLGTVFYILQKNRKDK